MFSTLAFVKKGCLVATERFCDWGDVQSLGGNIFVIITDTKFLDEYDFLLIVDANMYCTYMVDGYYDKAYCSD